MKNDNKKLCDLSGQHNRPPESISIRIIETLQRSSSMEYQTIENIVVSVFTGNY